MDYKELQICSDTHLSVVRACARKQSLPEGKLVHAQISKSRYNPGILLVNAIVNMYCKCISLGNAGLVFDTMVSQDVYTWTTMMTGYVQSGDADGTMKLFYHMQEHGPQPNSVSYVSFLSACTCLKSLCHGKHIHAHVIKFGFGSDIFVANTVVGMYGKCGRVEDVQLAFDGMPMQNVVTWNVVISAYAQFGYSSGAVNLLWKMDHLEIKPTRATYISLLVACASGWAVAWSKHVHTIIIKSGLETDAFVASALIATYAKAGNIQESRLIFNNVRTCDMVLWSTMISAYGDFGDAHEAINLLGQMRRQGLKPNKVAYIGIISGCAISEAIELGKYGHALLRKAGVESDIIIENALVSMYAKCGKLVDCCQVFDRMIECNQISWNALIAGYFQFGDNRCAIALLESMLHYGLEGEISTYSIILSAYANAGYLEWGKFIHTHLIQIGLASSVGNLLVDMYCKCGVVKDACQVFDTMCSQDIVSWTTMISGYADNGNGEYALKFLTKMQSYGLTPDRVTFISILAACSNLGLEDTGHHYFYSMSNLYGIVPTREHYACMVDLLSRVGYLHEAKDLIDTMPFQPGVMVWTPFLGACKIHTDIQLAEESIAEILQLDPLNAGALVSLSNMYAEIMNSEIKI